MVTARREMSLEVEEGTSLPVEEGASGTVRLVHRVVVPKGETELLGRLSISELESKPNSKDKLIAQRAREGSGGNGAAIKACMMDRKTSGLSQQ
jgi:hypothetical protein